MKPINLKFATRAYSEREALSFLQSHAPEIHISIRQLANLWNWHKSKVERFLKVLRTETLIETKISHGKTNITILTNPPIKEECNSNDQDNIETLIEADIKEATIENLSRDNFEDNSEIVLAQDIQCIEKYCETKPRQFQDDLSLKEEKKKPSQRRVKKKNFFLKVFLILKQLSRMN